MISKCNITLGGGCKTGVRVGGSEKAKKGVIMYLNSPLKSLFSEIFQNFKKCLD